MSKFTITSSDFQAGPTLFELELVDGKKSSLMSLSAETSVKLWWGELTAAVADGFYISPFWVSVHLKFISENLQILKFINLFALLRMIFTILVVQF